MDDLRINALRDQLTGMLIGLARATEGNEFLLSPTTAEATVAGLAATAPNGPFSEEDLPAMMERVDQEKRKLVPDCYNCAAHCGRTDNYDLSRLQTLSEEARTLKLQLLHRIRGIAVRTYAASQENFAPFLYKALYAIGMDDWNKEELTPILKELDAMD